MVFGRPVLIRERILLDAIALGGLLISCFLPIDEPIYAVIHLAPYILTLLTAGLTNRWTLTFPMVPIFILQSLRQVPAIRRSTQWASTLITSSSMLLIVIASILCLIFPPVKLPAIRGPYQVGVIDFFLPVKIKEASHRHETPSHVSVRLLYPTMDKPDGIPYLDPKISKEYCRQTVLFGAPPPLKQCGWFLHAWRLIRLPVRRNAGLVPSPTRLPVVVYSHGLGGSSELYSYQTMALAARGSLVMSMNHADGSAPVVKRRDGSILTYDFDIARTWLGKDYVAYVRRRRMQADLRARECLAATEALLRLNDSDSPDLLRLGMSLRGRLDTDRCTFMGHSFGGATALIAAARRPDLVQHVIAHEPAVDWMTDDARRSLFADSVLTGSAHPYTGGSGGYEAEDDSNSHGASVHDLDVLVMYSKEWKEKNWGESHILEEIYRNGSLGRQGGPSHFQIIEEAHHMEFSDVGMLTPVWLARVAGSIGKQNPISTALEIEQATVRWLLKLLGKDAYHT